MIQTFKPEGFTLVEILIALLIASIALIACMRALSISASGTAALHERSLALMAAENRLAELRLQRVFPSVGKSVQPCPQGTLDLICEQGVQNTMNASFRQVTIRARLPEGPVLAELDGLLSSLP
jgi:general secretion pathway protein I